MLSETWRTPSSRVLDPVQHAVEVVHELAEVVAGAVGGDPPGQVAGHDLGDRGVDGADASQHRPAGDHRPDQGQQGGDQETRDRGPPDQALDRLQLVHVPADQELVAPAESEAPGPGAVDLRDRPGRWRPRGGRPSSRRRPASTRGQLRRLPITGGTVGRHQEIDRRPGGTSREPLLDEGGEAAQTRRAVALGEAADLRLDGLVRLARPCRPRSTSR